MRNGRTGTDADRIPRDGPDVRRGHIPLRSAGLALLCVALAAACREAPREPPREARASPAAGLDALLDQVVGAYGGAEAIATAGALLQQGTATSAMRGGAEGRLLRLYDRPARLRVEVAYEDGSEEIRILDGAMGWQKGGASSVPMRQAMTLQAARLGLPALFAEFRDDLDDLGTVERGGGVLRRVALDFHRSLRLTAEIDPETGRILRTEGAILDPDGEPALVFATEYDDFREVDGVLFPFHETSYAQGVRTGETRLESVEILPVVPRGAFHPPVAPREPPPVPEART